ncbi:hypothetical protein [Micromonospora saelicesensis]|uniref:Uncharacterized protein n=1 Tax=Micromonospora saelicesensis TaxID=285676 RepID=A0A328NSE9_9ACTN|nr:hypothetical protein [Micromonospora saelicesensis]RAO32914.1 hypothetical protein PSN13_03604 [Micromonospora saelicesensis]RAO61434.1 hypothetical protein LUPAC06_00905 [Micromonospora saelicesensis]
MLFDVDNPPVEPPDGCRHRLLWRLCRALWEDHHRPDCAGHNLTVGCAQNDQLVLCHLARLAVEGLRTANGEQAVASPLWLGFARSRIATGDINLAAVMAEARWHRRRAGPTG